MRATRLLRFRPPSPSRRTLGIVLAALCAGACAATVALDHGSAPIAVGHVSFSGGTRPSTSTLPPEALSEDDVGPRISAASVPGGRSVDVPILLYHYIRINPHPTDRVGFNLSVTPQHFAQQMQLLHDAGAHTITLADLMHAMQTGTPLPPRSVVLTFDDGYADFATEAAPIMSQLGLRGTSFVVSGFLGRPNYMTTQQVLQVQAMGMTIGAHSVHHLGLAHVAPDIARAEIDISRQQLQALTGSPVDDFAYPYGDLDSTVVTLVEQAGFRDAVGTAEGSEHTLGEAYALTRIRIGGTDTLASFAVKAQIPMVTLHPVASLASLETKGVGGPGSPTPSPAAQRSPTAGPSPTATPAPSAPPTPTPTPTPQPTPTPAPTGLGPRTQAEAA